MASPSPSSASSSAASSPISIGWPARNSPSSSRASSFASDCSLASTWTPSTCPISNNLACAFPSWPTRSSLSPPLSARKATQHFYHNELPADVPTSYISDWDLFPEDLLDESEVPLLDEAPPPPRIPTAPVPLLPLYAPARPKARRRSSRKSSKQVAALTPIAELPSAQSIDKATTPK